MTDQAFRWARQQHPDLAAANITPLKAEASHRAFYRLAAPGRSLVLMVSPPDKEDNARFQRFAAIFHAGDIPVPQILFSRPEAGWYLLTDLGEQHLEAAYGTPDQTAALEAAMATLVRLQSIGDPAIPPYTPERFRDELQIFTEWFAARLMGAEMPAGVPAVFDALVARTRTQPQCCVHRDYHCRNLLYDPGTGAFGVVDFQDALVGPASYDPASLLHDCYHLFSEAEVSCWTARYLERSPLPLDPDTFTTDLEYMAVQRQLKAVGIFARLKLRDGRATHLRYIRPVLRRLENLSRRHTPLAALSAWLSEFPDQRVAEALAGVEAP